MTEPETASDQAESSDDLQAQQVALKTNRPNAVLPDGFASSSSCLECHADEYDSWHASFHRTMTQLVNDETAPEAIRDTSVKVDGQTYHFNRRDGRYFVTFKDPLARGEIKRREIVMMTGSHHMHVFWYESDSKGGPGELGIVYLKKEQRWIPRLSSFLRPPDAPEEPLIGAWNHTCSKCHSTHPRERFDPIDRDWDTHVVEFGIACEACHGEGTEHIRRHSNDESVLADRPALAAKDKVVNPTTIDSKASADICGRCHSIAFPDFDVLSKDDYMKQGLPFEPGQRLVDCEFHCIIQATPGHRDTKAFRLWSEYDNVNDSFWNDGMARVTGREYNGLIESPCYQHGEMSCLSCHTMHPSEGVSVEQWRDDQLKPDMRGDQACLQCHADYANRIPEHTHHAADSSGSRCQNCHMPHTTYGLLKTIRSHQISSPSTTASRDRPDACSLCHLDQSRKWVSSHLRDWYGQPLDEKQAEEDSISVAAEHLLQGDAAQRAIALAAFGWKPAQEASGTDWMEPLLLIGLDDPYDAVRIIASDALKTLPKRMSEEIDPLASREDRTAQIQAAVKKLEERLRIPNDRLDERSKVLFDAQGKFDHNRALQLRNLRDQRPVDLRE